MIEVVATENHHACDETITALGQERDSLNGEILLLRGANDGLTSQLTATRQAQSAAQRKLTEVFGLMHDFLVELDEEYRDDERVTQLINLGMPGFTKRISFDVGFTGSVEIEWDDAALSVDESRLREIVRRAIDGIDISTRITEAVADMDGVDVDETGDFDVSGGYINVDSIR